MQRAEQTGLGLSIAGHAAIFTILSLGLFAVTKPPVIPPAPMDVQIVDKVGLTVSAPEPPKVAPAQSVAPEIGQPEEAAPEPEPATAPPTPAPVQREAVAPPKPAPAPKPAPKAVAKPVAKPAPPKPTVKPSVAPVRGSKLGDDFRKGLTATPSTSTSQAPRVAAVGPAQQAALGRLIREQLKPHWKAPTGPDAEQLRTELRVQLAKDGRVTSVEVIKTTGQTDSNQGQVRLHQEAAMKAVRLASPFVGLPSELYSAWSVLETVGFDRRLSQ
jgi:outer membrane biosynthesis protein TonB